MTDEEGDNIKESLEFMSEDFSVVKMQQKAILELVEEVKTLWVQNVGPAYGLHAKQSGWAGAVHQVERRDCDRAPYQTPLTTVESPVLQRLTGY